MSELSSKLKMKTIFHRAFPALTWCFSVILAVLMLGCSDQASSSKEGLSESSSNAAAKASSKKKKKKKKTPPKEVYPIDKLSADTPIMIVEGRPVTQKQYADWLDMRCRIILAQDGKPYDAAKYNSTKKGIRSRIPVELIRRELMLHYAQTNGIVLSSSRIKKAKEEFLKTYGRNAKTVDQMAARLGGASTNVLSDVIYLTALDEECLERNATNDIHQITDAEVDAQMARIKKWNDIAAQKDKESYEKAAKAKKEILAGTPFEVVTRKYAEVAPDDGHAWDTVELGEFQADEPLAQWLMTAKVGDISDPLAYDDVIAIFGLVRMYDGEAPEGYEAMKQYELVRCSFHAYEKIEEPEDREELRASMLEERRSQVIRELGSRLLESAKVEFPKGEEIFNEVRPPPPRRPPAKKKNKRKAKPAGTKSAEAKPAGTKPAEVKPAGTKPTEVKPAGTKPTEKKPAEVKPAGTKPTEQKPAEKKPAV